MNPRSSMPQVARHSRSFLGYEKFSMFDFCPKPTHFSYSHRFPAVHSFFAACYSERSEESEAEGLKFRRKSFSLRLQILQYVQNNKQFERANFQNKKVYG